MRSIHSAAVLLAVAGCTHVRPDDLSAEEHRAEADRQDEAASKEMARYDPKAEAARDALPPANLPEEAQPDLYFTYNPTAAHERAAERHMRLAWAHREAAVRLEKFEDEACAGVPLEARASCPLVTARVAVVEETPRGVRLHLRANANGQRVLAQMQCHLAFARSEGFPDGASCPLYIKGVSIGLQDNGRVIEVRGDGAQTARRIRHEARELFAPASIG
jgi:hypothetical protein